MSVGAANLFSQTHSHPSYIRGIYREQEGTNEGGHLRATGLKAPHEEGHPFKGVFRHIGVSNL